MRQARRRSSGTSLSSSRSSGWPAPGRASSSPRAMASAMTFSARKSSMSVAYRSAVASRIEAAGQKSRARIARNAVGMSGELIPIAPAIDRMAAALELVDRRAREARLDVQGVARLAQPEAPRQPARPGERLLDVLPEVDHRDVGLQVDLRLSVGAHAAEHRPQLLVLERERSDQRVQRHLARLEAIRVL